MLQRDDHIDSEVLDILRQGTGPTTNRGTLKTSRVSDIEAKPVHWLWPNRIARGKLTIIAGNPGLGKSQISASIAAVLTTGGHWPVDRDRCEAGDVLFLSAEDDPADTLRPRLEAAGANLARVHHVDGVIKGYTGDGTAISRSFTLQSDLPALEAKLCEIKNVAAVIIDPITAYLGGDIDSHKNSDIRGLLAPLSDLAAKYSAAIIGISHLSKANASQALMRVTGSLAFVAAARAAYLVAPDPQDKTRRLFVPMKNNLGPDVTGLAFRIEGATVESSMGQLGTSRVAWESDPVSVTADEAMQAEAGDTELSARDEAAEWLQEVLSDGPLPANEIYKKAGDVGIAKRTLRRAAKKLGVDTEKSGMAGGWRWILPPKVAKTSEGVQEKDVAIFGEVGHLRDSGRVEVDI